MAEAQSVVLAMKSISKRFPGVQALNSVDFDLHLGEVHVLLGENGAGKSTLIKILAGAHQRDAGEIYWKGQPVEIRSPQEAQKLGISVIYQEFNLIPSLSIGENIFLGREPILPNGLIDKRKIYEDSVKILESLDLDLDPRQLVRDLGVAQQQMVEVAKALSVRAEVIVMDEPTAALGDREIEQLFKTIAMLTARRVSIIYISHRLQETLRIGDRITVLRDGQHVATLPAQKVTVDELIRLMVGRQIKEKFPKDHAQRGKELFRVEELSSPGILHNISFSLHAGEVVGLAGLVGAGRTELARAIFGADPLAKGRFLIDGQEKSIRNPSDAVALGLGYLPEDRKRQGLVLGMSVVENITLASVKDFCRFIWMKKRREREISQRFVDSLRIRTPSLGQSVKNLSGGNQQKIVLAKWLCSRSRILVFDEPTRGIDVGAKVEVYQLINDLVKQGAAILMISSELPEILAMSDRILVMRQGRLVGELEAGSATQESVLHLAMGSEG